MSNFRELVHNCSWDGPNPSCEKYRDQPGESYKFTEWYSRAIDGVYTYAYALDEFITGNCNEARQDKSILESCWDAELFLQYLRSTSFSGVTGDISFDEAGDIIGKTDLF